MRVGGLAIGLALVVATKAPAAPSPLFGQRCAVCHQANGAGLAGQFPRLSGRVATIAQSKPGRHYLALVMLNGLAGPIAVDGHPIAGLMPSMAALPDQSLADILNHVIQLGPPAKGKRPDPFTAGEIAAVRREGSIGATRVNAERTKLAAAGLLP